MSSSTMNSTLGAPSWARLGCGQAGVDTSAVRPITPGNVVPGLYSFSAMSDNLLEIGKVNALDRPRKGERRPFVVVE